MKDLIQRLKGASALIVGLLILIVVLQNTGSVQTRILFFSITMPHALLLFVTLAVGFALGASWAGKKIALKK